MNEDELQDIVDDIEEDREEESNLIRSLKRVYIVIIILIILALLIINTNTGNFLVNLYASKVASSVLDADYNYELKSGGKVIFRQDVYENLLVIHDDNQQHEFKVCLTGFKTESNYYVTGLYEPRIINQEVFSVTAIRCNNETVVSLHSHPPMSCIFSNQDQTSFKQFKQTNPNGIYAVMCSENRMSFLE
jgi:proteasome lid subunit RPN8/RPN11